MLDEPIKAARSSIIITLLCTYTFMEIKVKNWLKYVMRQSSHEITNQAILHEQTLRFISFIKGIIKNQGRA